MVTLVHFYCCKLSANLGRYADLRRAHDPDDRPDLTLMSKKMFSSRAHGGPDDWPEFAEAREQISSLRAHGLDAWSDLAPVREQIPSRHGRQDNEAKPDRDCASAASHAGASSWRSKPT